MNLNELYKNKKVIITAHRGFSSKYPENSIIAFKKAVEVGTDLIEFDIRGTRENVPVILHDSVIDKISNGTGSSSEYLLKEIKQFDFSYNRNGQSGERWGSSPIRIATFKEALETIPANIGLNIQIKDTNPALLKEVCSLFHNYNLYNRAYLTMSTFQDAEQVKNLNSDIEVCILERKKPLTMEILKRMKEFGCRYLQPLRKDVNPELCRIIKEMGFHANMYYSNTDSDNRKYIAFGMQGILTDYPDILFTTIKSMSG